MVTMKLNHEEISILAAAVDQVLEEETARLEEFRRYIREYPNLVACGSLSPDEQLESAKKYIKYQECVEQLESNVKRISGLFEKIEDARVLDAFYG